jgi:four helix bundle protein
MAKRISNCHEYLSNNRNISEPGKYGLAAQIKRSCVSIPSNIAEGRSRNSDKDYSRFAEISLGSAFELETQLLITKEIKYGNPDLVDTTLDMLEEEEKIITAFIKTLSGNK